jgi:hypothetical protein
MCSPRGEHMASLYVQCSRWSTHTAKVERARDRHTIVDTAQHSATQTKSCGFGIALGAFVFLELRNGMGWVDGGWAMGFHGAKIGYILILCLLFVFLGKRWWDWVWERVLGKGWDGWVYGVFRVRIWVGRRWEMYVYGLCVSA